MTKRRSKPAPPAPLAPPDESDLATASGVVVFLDVDGVLLPFSRGATDDFVDRLHDPAQHECLWNGS